MILFFLNELLSDINSLEKKLSDKITQLSIVIQNQKLISDQNFELSKGNYKILLEKMTYGVVKKGAYNYRKRFDESSTIDTSNKSINFYNNRLKDYFLD